MLPAITISDFVGPVKIGVDTYSAPDFTDFVDWWYPKIVREVLGQAAYAEVVASDPLPQKWQDVFLGCDWLDVSAPTSEPWARHNDGLKAAAVRRLYFLWIREAGNVSTSVGLVSNANENAVAVSRGDVFAMANQRWNEATDMICELMGFLKGNKTISMLVASYIQPVPGTTRIYVDSTQYLAVGDTVSIVGDIVTADYTVSALLADTWIEVVTIIASPSKVSWQPFAKYNIPTRQQGYAV